MKPKSESFIFTYQVLSNNVDMNGYFNFNDYEVHALLKKDEFSIIKTNSLVNEYNIFYIKSLLVRKWKHFNI